MPTDGSILQNPISTPAHPVTSSRDSQGMKGYYYLEVLPSGSFFQGDMTCDERIRGI